MKTKNFTNPLPHACITILLMFCCVVPVNAQRAHYTEDHARHAAGVLQGVFFDYSKEKAVTILHETAEQDSVPYAMNALGQMYLKGKGVKKNMKEALHWLEEAGKHGFMDAYHDIGAVYKDGRSGVKQDFPRAYEAFLEGARLGSRKCCYDTGFMLYKGLGCEQSYTKAMELFEIAAKMGHSGAMYMLGLCYRNGYGTEQNEEKGIELLNKAARRGFKAARIELARRKPENYLHKTQAETINSGCSPLSMSEINDSHNDTTIFNGKYEGQLVVYDWSGKYILQEKPVKVSVNRNSNEVTGSISIGHNDIPFYADITDDGMLKFRDSYANLKERYTRKGKVRYRLNYTKLGICKDAIIGELSVYSLNHREPEKPMHIQLHRSDRLNRKM